MNIVLCYHYKRCGIAAQPSQFAENSGSAREGAFETVATAEQPSNSRQLLGPVTFAIHEGRKCDCTVAAKAVVNLY